MAISSPEMMLVPVMVNEHLPSSQKGMFLILYHTQVDVTETTATDLSANAVFVTDSQILLHDVSDHSGAPNNVPENNRCRDRLRREDFVRKARVRNGTHHGRHVGVLAQQQAVSRMLDDCKVN